MADNIAFDGNDDSATIANGSESTSFSTSIFVEPTAEEKKANGDIDSPLQDADVTLEVKSDTYNEVKGDVASVSSKEYSFKSNHSADKIPEPYAGLNPNFVLYYFDIKMLFSVSTWESFLMIMNGIFSVIKCHASCQDRNLINQYTKLFTQIFNDSNSI